MKRVLITGNNGFIGKNLEKHLSDRDYKVYGIDTFFGYDIRTFNMKNEEYDAIIHLAAISDIQTAEKYSKETIDIKVMGTFNLLRESHKKNVKRFIFISSAAVYGFEYGDSFSFLINP